MKVYSPFFETLYDEPKPVGSYNNREIHYSILRAIVFTSPNGDALPESRVHDFAVIWDEDHDVRIIEAIQKIYTAGLLPCFLALGERKACLTGHFTPHMSATSRKKALPLVEEICTNIANDFWTTEFTKYLSLDDHVMVKSQEDIFFANILNQWSLGPKPIPYASDVQHEI